MRAVLFLYKPGASVWLEGLRAVGLGWGRAVGGEAASGKWGYNTAYAVRLLQRF